MQTVSKLLAAAAILAGSATYAHADMVELTAEEVSQVTQACEVGLPLIPVSSDYGYDTGEYALPLASQDGNVNSALIVSATALKQIPECKAEIDMIAELETTSNDSVS